MTKPEEHREQNKWHAIVEEAEKEIKEKAEAAPEGEAVNVDQLRAELAQAKKEAEESKNLYLRARADQENIRERGKRDVENAYKYSLEKFSFELLSVLDNLELSVLNAEPESKLLPGVKLTLDGLLKAMQKFGIQAFDPKGEMFDPNRHEAMGSQEDPTATPGSVIAVYQKGYLLQDRLLRAARVVIAKAPEEPLK